MLKALAFDVRSFFKIVNCEIGDDWFSTFEIPGELESIKRVVERDVVYFLDQEISQDDVSLIVVDLGKPAPIFNSDGIDRYVFDRIATIAKSVFTNSVSIPFSWHMHSEGSMCSVYAATKSVGAGARIHYDTNPAGNRDLLVFARVDESIPFNRVPRPDDQYLAVRENLPAALSASMPKRPLNFKATGIDLSHRLSHGFTRGTSLKEWYESKLTDEQRAFVDKPYDGPVRLRGAAGTGKTLSLAVKFMRDSCRFESEGIDRRFCFLTHSAATADLVGEICGSLDPVGLIAGMGKHAGIQVRTLYDLAHEYLRFDLDQLNPLSLDGREGRLLQAELIRDTLKSMRSDISFARYSDISPCLRNGWEGTDAQSKEKLIIDLANEFASVLDADGVWAGTEKGEKYAKGQLGYRPAWLLELPTERDRRYVLEIHRRYRQLLSEMNTLSVDQMVSDFNSFLDRNTWDMLKKTKGFDAVFVDELHLFTSVERQVLHKLMKGNVGGLGAASRPAIFMAYDVKQSPRDTFTQMGDTSLFTASTQLQNSDLVKLSKIFRYTPQIADFLYDLDATFPAIDLAGEWEPYAAQAEVAEGERPKLYIYKDEAELLRRTFEAAITQAKKLGGRRVAILCINEELYDQYDKIAKIRFRGNLIHINSREPSTDLKHAGKKVVFSMPEFVAGLQFEVIYLIHVDAQDAPIELTVGERRRLISNVYLGASRAERELYLGCCESRGGPASYLKLAIERKTLAQ
jgi:hypothetical protein